MNIKKEFVYEKIENVPSCHASTVLPLPDGRVMCAWFAGEHESNDNVRIWYSVKENGVWSAPCKIFSAENGAKAHGGRIRRNRMRRMRRTS